MIKRALKTFFCYNMILVTKDICWVTHFLLLQFDPTVLYTYIQDDVQLYS